MRNHRGVPSSLPPRLPRPALPPAVLAMQPSRVCTEAIAMTWLAAAVTGRAVGCWRGSGMAGPKPRAPGDVVLCEMRVTRGIGAVQLATLAAVIAGLLSWAAPATALSVGRDPLVLNAQLLASDAPISLAPASVSGQTIVASGRGFIGGRVQDVVYVFTRPAAGWSDTGKPTATLVGSDGGGVSEPVAISGGTVVAGDEHLGGQADVFTEPAGGWSGTVHASARLIASDASKFGGLARWAIDGRTIVAGSPGTSGSPGEAYVFTEPAGGWSGTLPESAKLFASAGVAGDGFGSQVAISGQTIAVSAPSARSAGGRLGGGRVYVFTEPAGGWSGTRNEQATLSASSSSVGLAGDSGMTGASAIAVSGNSVFATADAPSGGGGGVGEVYVFSAAAAGWSGAIHETHVLSFSDSSTQISLDHPLAASGGTLVAGPYVFTEPAGGWVNATETAKLAGRAESVGIDGQTVVMSGGPVVSVFVEPSGGWSSSVKPSAALRLTGPGGQILFQSAALSGPVAVAGAPDGTDIATPAQGAVYVYVEPAGGWSSETESAKLVASDGKAGDRFGQSVAISGDTVVAVGAGGLYVFAKPAGGWSGTIHESAKLTFTDPAAMSFFAISGNTVVAAGATGLYVFTKPAGGWSGTIPKSATLTIPHAPNPCFDGPYSVAIDGSTIAAACEHNAYVFTEPAGGWSGTIQPRATLLPPTKKTFAGSVAVLGSSIAVASDDGDKAIDPVVFNEPARGWSGTIRPTARLKLTADSGYAFEFVVGSGDTIATLVVPDNPICTGGCTATLYAFRRPIGGWSGTITGSSTDAFPSGSALNGFPYVFATDQGTIATDGEGGVDLLTIRPGPPSATNVSLSGLATGRPKLRFTLHAGQSAAPIHTIQLTLPRGLRFFHHPRAVRITAAAQQVELSPGTLTATLRRPAESLEITIARPAISELKPLAAAIRRVRRYNRTHRRKHRLAIRIRCAVTDATGQRTNLTLHTKIS